MHRWITALQWRPSTSTIPPGHRPGGGAALAAGSPLGAGAAGKPTLARGGGAFPEGKPGGSEEHPGHPSATSNPTRTARIPAM
jgi:hypothetical protein